MNFSRNEFLHAVGGHKDGGLTGRRRYVRGLIPPPPLQPLLILQVEESVWNDAYEGTLGRWVCQWRDATPNDVNQGELA